MHEHGRYGINTEIVLEINGLVLRYAKEYPGVRFTTTIQRRTNRSRNVVDAVSSGVVALNGLGIIALHGASLGIDD
jgi:phage head maturation protease